MCTQHAGIERGARYRLGAALGTGPGSTGGSWAATYPRFIHPAHLCMCRARHQKAIYFAAATYPRFIQPAHLCMCRARHQKLFRGSCRTSGRSRKGVESIVCCKLPLLHMIAFPAVCTSTPLLQDRGVGHSLPSEGKLGCSRHRARMKVSTAGRIMTFEGRF